MYAQVRVHQRKKRDSVSGAKKGRFFPRRAHFYEQVVIGRVDNFCVPPSKMEQYFTMKHGYAAVAASAVLIWAQVAVYDHYFLSEDTPIRLAHHARQLPALVPKLLLDVGLILLMGPSPTATPSDRE